jgi:hypothetical protein
MCASVADPAVHDDLFLLGKLIYPEAQFLERNEMGTLDRLRRMFLLCAHVEQKEILSRSHFVVQLLWSDILASNTVEKHAVPPEYAVLSVLRRNLLKKLEQLRLPMVILRAGRIRRGMRVPSAHAWFTSITTCMPSSQLIDFGTINIRNGI